MAEDFLSVTGMVIDAIPIGDYDKRITLLTSEMGKVQVFVRGAKRPKSAFGAAANLFVYGTFDLHIGKNYNLAKVNVTQYFENLAQDLDAVFYGSYFLEVAGYFANEGEPAGDLLKLLYASVLALTKESFPKRLVRRIFEWKVLALNGEAPDVFSCRICGRNEDLAYFSAAREGCICSHCNAPLGVHAVDASTLYTLQFILRTPVTKLFSFSVSEEVLECMEGIVSDYFYMHTERDFKSLELLKKID